MKKYILLLFVLLSISCVKDIDPATLPIPTVTISHENVSFESVTINCSLTNVERISSFGVLYGTESSLNNAKSVTKTIQSGVNEYSFSINGLNSNTTYYFRGFVKGGKNEISTTINSFTTATIGGDYMALSALYEATGGDKWINKTNWCINEDISTWYGVTVDNDGNVIGLSLENNNLSGMIDGTINLNYLKSLNVSSNNESSTNKISFIDASGFPMLGMLFSNNTKLETIDVSKNPKLTEIDCGRNLLSELNVSKNELLETLFCSANNITSLDLSKNTSLTKLYCLDNELTTLDLMNNTKLQTLYSFFNNMSSLYIRHLTNLDVLECGNQNNGLILSLFINSEQKTKWNNSWSSLSNNSNITLVEENPDRAALLAFYQSTGGDNWINKNGWGSDENIQSWYGITVNEDGRVIKIKLNDNKLSGTIPESISLEYLEELNVSSTYSESDFSKYNHLTSLNAYGFPALKNLDCSRNDITNLDVSNNSKLTTINFISNQVSSFKESPSTYLTEINCSFNQLTQLNLSKNTALTALLCQNNLITDIDIAGNTGLKSLYIENNKLKTLKTGNNSAMIELVCYNNSLSLLNVRLMPNLNKLMAGNQKDENGDINISLYLTDTQQSQYGATWSSYSENSNVKWITNPLVLVTDVPHDITQTTAVSGGKIIDLNGDTYTITACGVCYSTSTGPTIDLTTKTSDTAVSGVFTSYVTELSPNSTYYLRAYVSISTGKTIYGEEYVFSTNVTGDNEDMGDNDYEW